MKSWRMPALLFGGLYLAFLGYLTYSAEHLPERVATHFDGAGHPNGWMSRSALLKGGAAFGLAFPLLVVGICALVRFLPAAAINLPRKEYWLAPERRGETNSYFLFHAWWLA